MNLYNRFLFCNMFLPLGRYLHGGYYWNRKTSMPLLYNVIHLIYYSRLYLRNPRLRFYDAMTPIYHPKNG